MATEHEICRAILFVQRDVLPSVTGGYTGTRAPLSRARCAGEGRGRRGGLVGAHALPPFFPAAEKTRRSCVGVEVARLSSDLYCEVKLDALARSLASSL